MPQTPVTTDAEAAMTRRTTAIARLEEHPNLPEVLGVLARLAHVADDDLPRLAAAWTNDAFLAARPATGR